MSLIHILREYIERKDKENLEKEEQEYKTQRKIKMVGYQLAEELNGILAHMPRINGMSVVTQAGGLCPVNVATQPEYNRLVYVLRWSKSLEEDFCRVKLADINDKVTQYLEFYRERVVRHYSQANAIQMKQKYYFILRGFQVKLVQQDRFNVYLYVEMRLR